MPRFAYLAPSLMHVLAAGAAVIYIWQISQTAFLQSGLQFVAPLAVIMVVHGLWLWGTGGLTPGFAAVIYRRSAVSSVGLAVAIFLSHIFAPMPAYADVGDTMQMILTTVFCVAIVAVVVGAMALVLYLVFKVIREVVNTIRHKGDPPDHNSRLFDMGSLAVGALIVSVASLEGVPGSYAFTAQHQERSSQFIAATPDHVWQVMETATSPDFALPDILRVFPQPVAVVVDEGSTLGAMRKVAFEGREGAGHLTLQVVSRDDARAVFNVVSDTSPFAMWIAHQSLTYEVQPEGDGTRLTVELAYERRLAPAWFFNPVMKGAAQMAMDVLARDVKARSEG